MKPMPDDDRVYVIAEAGVNHNGKPELALKLVDTAAEAGADAVKFQTFRADSVATEDAPKAAYQSTTTDTGEFQLALLRRLELSHDVYFDLMARCRKKGIDFLSTPFDTESLRFLAEDLGLETIKLGSGEVTNGPLLLSAARTGRRLILSTGMSSLDEVEAALGVLAFGYIGTEEVPSHEAFREAFALKAGRRALLERVTLLHCTTEYPAPAAEANLRAMDTLAGAFGLPVGLSDHTGGWVVAVAAAARGAGVIEKHFTLDCSLPGPDHKASLEPDGLAEMIAAIRTVEVALGDGAKVPTPSESCNLDVVRRSLVALRPINQGDGFTEANLGAKRPGGGISPMDYWDWLGRPAPRAFAPSEKIEQ